MSGALEAFLSMINQPTASQDDIYKRNAPYVAPGATDFNTQLPPLQEATFRNWVAQNNVPFDPTKGVQDYDMRGFWLGLQNGHPQAMTAVNPNDNQMHYPDYWKTPYHESFSNESKFAGPVAPQWNEKDQLVAP